MYLKNFFPKFSWNIVIDMGQFLMIQSIHIHGASRKGSNISEAAERLSGDGMEGLFYR